MSVTPEVPNPVALAYRKAAKHYDLVMSLLRLLRPVGFDLEGWRREAVRALELKRGDRVVDVGCGTGLNFPLLRDAIGREGESSESI